jgi:hypothetical protein
MRALTVTGNGYETVSHRTSLGVRRIRHQNLVCGTRSPPGGGLGCCRPPGGLSGLPVAAVHSGHSTSTLDWFVPARLRIPLRYLPVDEFAQIDAAWMHGLAIGSESLDDASQ